MVPRYTYILFFSIIFIIFFADFQSQHHQLQSSRRDDSPFGQRKVSHQYESPAQNIISGGGRRRHKYNNHSYDRSQIASIISQKRGNQGEEYQQQNQQHQQSFKEEQLGYPRQEPFSASPNTIRHRRVNMESGDYEKYKNGAYQDYSRASYTNNTNQNQPSTEPFRPMSDAERLHKVKRELGTLWDPIIERYPQKYVFKLEIKKKQMAQQILNLPQRSKTRNDIERKRMLEKDIKEFSEAISKIRHNFLNNN